MHARAGIEVERLEGVGQVHLVRRRVLAELHGVGGAGRPTAARHGLGAAATVGPLSKTEELVIQNKVHFFTNTAV